MRYILFAGFNYHPLGGANDILGTGDSIEDLQNSAILRYNPKDWWHIYDTEEKEIVAFYRGGF
jgi:hypothetical protein